MYLIEKNAPPYMTGLIRTKKKEYTRLMEMHTA